MKGNTLLIVLTVSAGVLSFLLYRAVIHAPIPKEAHLMKKAESMQKLSPLGQGANANTNQKGEVIQGMSPQVETSGNRPEPATPFEDSKKLSPEETKRIFEAEMKANMPPGKSPEEVLRSSMDMERLEKMSEEEKRETFLRSMGDAEQLTEEERRARFEESMGIK